MVDDDLDADVARLKAKWFGPRTTPPKALDAEEEAVAAKWMGREAAHKLATTRDGERYRPPVVTARWGYIPATRPDPRVPLALSSRALGDYWYVEVTSDGKKSTLFEGERAGCLQAIARLQRMNVPVVRIGREEPQAELHRTERASSARHDILRRLGSFRA